MIVNSKRTDRQTDGRPDIRAHSHNDEILLYEGKVAVNGKMLLVLSRKLIPWKGNLILSRWQCDAVLVNGCAFRNSKNFAGGSSNWWENVFPSDLGRCANHDTVTHRLAFCYRVIAWYDVFQWFSIVFSACDFIFMEIFWSFHFRSKEN